MNFMQLARQAGLALLLDGRIGQQQYMSVSGSIEALSRFARAVGAASIAESQRSRISSARPIGTVNLHRIGRSRRQRTAEAGVAEGYPGPVSHMKIPPNYFVSATAPKSAGISSRSRHRPRRPSSFRRYSLRTEQNARCVPTERRSSRGLVSGT
jgi:hypothetical protein